MKPFRDRSIKQKLTVILVATTSTALLLAGAALAGFRLVTVRQEMVEDLSILAEGIGINSAAALSSNVQAPGQEILQTLRAQPRIVAATIFDADGRVFARYVRQGMANLQVPDPPTESGYAFDWSRLRVYRPIVTGGTRLGIVYLEADLEVEARLRRFAVFLILVTIVSVAVASLLMARLTELVLKPLRRAVRHVRAIGGGRYDVSIDSSRQDEIGDMLRALDHMRKNLVQRTAALRASEERFSLAMDAANDAVWELNLETMHMYASPQWTGMLGYEASGVGPTRDDFASHIHPDDRLRVLARFDGYRTGTVEKGEIEFRILHKDGHYLNVLARVVAARNAAGTAVRLVGTLSDRTEQTRAHQRAAAQYAATGVLATATTLRETAPRFVQAICEAGEWDLGCARLMDRKTRQLTCFALWRPTSIESSGWEAAYRARAYAPGSGLTGRVWASGQPVWVVNSRETSDFPSEALAGGMQTAFFWPLVIRNNVVAVFEFFSREVRPCDADWSNMFAALGAHIEQSLERRQFEETLEATATRLKAIFDSVPDGIVVINESGGIESVSPAAERLFGYRAEEVVRRQFQLLLGEAYRGTVAARLRQDFETGRDAGTADEVEGLCKDGTVVPLELALSQMQVGTSRKFIGIVRDIRERKRLERLKDEFVSTVSHELRTPLTSISAALGLLDGGTAGALSDRAARLLSIAHRNCERLVRLVNDILDIVKIDSGKTVFNLRPLELQGLVEHAMETTRDYARTLGVELELDPASEDGTVVADADRLTQVMTNLLGNACKYSPSGGKVQVSLRRSDRGLIVRVRDHGPGVPEAFRARLFDRFAQADSTDTRQKSGTGLGLNIAKSIVERHGGRIGFENPEEGGAVFWFEVPLRQDLIEAPDPLALSTGTRTLICTADRELADTLTTTFAQARLPVDVTRTPEEALDRLAKNGHALLVLDLSVAHGEELALVRRLRASLSTTTPIIALSPYEATNDISELRALGILDWLEKPIDRSQLVRALQRAGAGSGRRVLHVDDDPDLRAVVHAALSPMAMVTSVETVEEARRQLEQPFDVVILDLDLADGRGAELLPVVAGRAGGALPVVIFSGTETSPDVALQVHAALVKSKGTLSRLVAAVKSLIAADDEHSRTVTSQ